MNIYKFQHTIQIIRWMGLTANRYDYDAWVSVSTAIHYRMGQETQLMEAMKACDSLKKHFQVIHVTLKREKAVTKLAEIEADF